MMCVCMYVCVYVCMYVCMCDVCVMCVWCVCGVCVVVYIYICIPCVYGVYGVFGVCVMQQYNDCYLYDVFAFQCELCMHIHACIQSQFGEQLFDLLLSFPRLA